MSTKEAMLLASEKEKLLAMIDSHIHRNQDGTPMDIGEKSNKSLRYSYYYIIRQHLSGEAKEIFEGLHVQFGDLEHPIFRHYIGGGIAPIISPKSQDELKVLPMIDLAKFLNEWAPPDQWDGPSIRGLGLMLEIVVPDRVDEFLDHLDQFKIQEKTYVRAMINGFYQALSQKKLQWDKVVDYLLWASGQQNESKDDVSKLADAGALRWTFQVVCYFLMNVFDLKENGIPFALREQVWKVIVSGLSHPEEEDKHVFNKMRNVSNPALCIDCVDSMHGVALKTTIHYAFWVKRNLGLTQKTLSIEEAPEIFAILDRCLDLSVEKSQIVRLVYGRLIPQLLSLNRKWFQAKKNSFFQRLGRWKDYWVAAWNENILFNQPCRDVFKELKNHYILAIDRLKLNGDGSDDKTCERLVEPILLFLYGELELNSDVLIKLYSKHDVSLKKQVLDKIWRILINKEQDSNPDLVKRAISFWNFRVEECRKWKEPNDRIELAELGSWLKLDCFDDEWVLDQVIEVLNLCHSIKSDCVIGNMMKRLPKLVDKHFTKVAEALRLMVDHQVAEDYEFHAYFEEMKVLFSKLLATEAREKAIKTIHRLGAYGFGQFGVLLKEQEQIITDMISQNSSNVQDTQGGVIIEA